MARRSTKTYLDEGAVMNGVFCEEGGHQGHPGWYLRKHGEGFYIGTFGQLAKMDESSCEIKTLPTKVEGKDATWNLGLLITPTQLVTLIELIRNIRIEKDRMYVMTREPD